jgi:MraZ protein
MFTGRHDHTIDKKGRLSVPAAFRSEILRKGEGPPMLTKDGNHLAFYPKDDWEVIMNGFAKQDPLDEAAQKLIRYTVGNAMECPIDSQGRILVPPHLRTDAGLDGKVSLVGMISKIEIWDAALYDNEDKLTESNLPGIRQQVRQAPGSENH